MKFVNKWLANTSGTELDRIDAFYKNTVSGLSCEARRQYCVNLIGRLKADLRHCSCPKELQRIRNHIRAADSEIRTLGR